MYKGATKTQIPIETSQVHCILDHYPNRVWALVSVEFQQETIRVEQTSLLSFMRVSGNKSSLWELASYSDDCCGSQNS
jgi:hypothetical protein